MLMLFLRQRAIDAVNSMLHSKRIVIFSVLVLFAGRGRVKDEAPGA
jgi:hypothetical protein